MNKFQQMSRLLLGQATLPQQTQAHIFVIVKLLDQLYQASAISYASGDSLKAELVAQVRKIDAHAADQIDQLVLFPSS